MTVTSPVAPLCNLVRKAAIATTAAVALVAFIAMVTVAGQATAAADVTNHVAVCHSTEVSGVDTDDCVGNPAADSVPDPGYQVWVEPRFFLGLGIG